MDSNKDIIGIPVLKGAQFLYNDIREYVKQFSNREYPNWKLNLNYHHGGYAKINKELIIFIKKFEELNNIPLDAVYTGKLLFAIQSMIKKKELKKNSTIIAIHTGGLQGNDGMKNKIDKLLS